MTRQPGNGSVEFDPEGSIFLPKTSNPEREFNNWDLQLLLGRGIAEGKDSDQILELHRKLEEARSRYLGAVSLRVE